MDTIQAILQKTVNSQGLVQVEAIQPLAQPHDLSLDLQGYFRRAGNNAAARIPVVELVGNGDEFRKLGLLLATIALSRSETDIVIRLTRNKFATINAVMIPKASMEAALFRGIVIEAVQFQVEPARSIVTDLPQHCLPWFGFVNIHGGRQPRLNYQLPDWVQSAIVFQGSAESNLLLAKLLLDLSADSEGSFEGFSLTHQDRSVCSGSYEAGFWLAGTEYDQYPYEEY